MDRFDWLELEKAKSTAKQEPRPAKPAPRRIRPSDGPSYYAAAREMREAGYLKAAADFYRKAVGLDDHHYAAWVELIDTLVRVKDLKAADAASSEALANYRQVRPLFGARALVLAYLGRFDEALPHSDVSVEGGDRHWYSRCVRGEVMLRMSLANRFQALDQFEEAAGMAEGPWEAYWMSGWALLEAGLPVLAASHFAEAAHRKPRAAACWLSLGESFQALRLYEQATFYYQRVIELDPGHEPAFQRQKECSASLFGLMSAFRRPDLQSRWRKEFESEVRREEGES